MVLVFSIPIFFYEPKFSGKEICLWKKYLLKTICSAMSAWSSVYENKFHLTKPFQTSQSWHQVSVYEKKVLVQRLHSGRYGHNNETLIL